ncbi:hypothetical protein B0H67DRAFT_589589 [Lasiosphaeris hirsuta]|uniref:Uncharacterized protein n=1 Tax=Lasiosphaeris hirsuta TaxID=260670 RepID=A0AA40A340_9PEZI|nr:hypothetical protein B0H67DRAFT_589589 [Lasiosphaeris hirsuta]
MQWVGYDYTCLVSHSLNNLVARRCKMHRNLDCLYFLQSAIFSPTSAVCGFPATSSIWTFDRCCVC